MLQDIKNITFSCVWEAMITKGSIIKHTTLLQLLIPQCLGHNKQTSYYIWW